MLKFRASKLTDDEFVERIRRQTPANRKILAGMSALYGVMLVTMLCYVPRYIHSFRDVAPDASAYDRGFALGIFLGATLGGSFIVLTWHLVHSLIMAFGPQFFRIHRLLLKYYDAAASTNTSRNQ
jgi:hypothetical protein